MFKKEVIVLIHKVLYPVLVAIIGLLLIFIVIQKNVPNHHDYLKLTGESAHWKVTDYEIELTPSKLSAGDGQLDFKPQDEDGMIEYYKFRMQAIINGKETSLQAQSVSGQTDFQDGVNTGHISGPTLTTEVRNPITLQDIDEIYAVIEWEKEGGDMQKEEILFYHSGEQDEDK